MSLLNMSGRCGMPAVFAMGLALALWVSVARADVAVNWGGAYVNPSQPLQGENSAAQENGDWDGQGDALDARDGRLWSTSTALSPASGYSGTSATFYGAGVQTREDGTAALGAWSNWQVFNNAAADQIRIGRTAAGSRAVHAFVYWDKADFLNGLSGYPLYFNVGNQLSVTLGTLVNIGQARWLVRDGSQFYMSQATITLTNGSTQTLSFGISDDGSWATYNPPSANLGINFNQAGASFSTRNFTDVTAVGFYFEQDAFNVDPEWQNSAFSATMTPEPATLALLCVSAVAAYAARRRRLGATLPGGDQTR